MTAFNMGHRGNGRERNFSAKEERKLRKPLIEKKRRERINCSLEQLKGIMVDAYNLDQSKLEKADVLEVTVQHMEGLQKGHGSGSPSGPSIGFDSRQRYSSGYIQCMHEVHNLLKSCPGMDKPLGARLLNHLLKSFNSNSQSLQPCCLQMHHATPPLQPSPPPIGSSPLHPGVFHPAPLSPFSPPGGDPSMWRPW
uniref:Hairy-related 8a n=1 Tax=Oncorhynchus mykiss TaxID=8022 RepID=A0A8K9UK15_ONCMY